MKFNLLVGYVAVRSEISVLFLKKEIRILGGYRHSASYLLWCLANGEASIFSVESKLST